jgi:nucleoside-diphosphate-sugar epimerase
MSQQNLRVMVTGGSGFIGSAVCRHLAGQNDVAILNYDKLTYAASPASLALLDGKADYQFVQGDVADAATVSKAIKAFRPNVIMHLAAESHVDRSITGPGDFVQTNIVGTYTMLQAALEHWLSLEGWRRTPSASTTSRPTRCSAAWAPRACSPRPRPTTRARPIRRRRPRRTTWPAPGITPTACRWSSRTARTTTAPITSPRS